MTSIDQIFVSTDDGAVRQVPVASFSVTIDGTSDNAAVLGAVLRAAADALSPATPGPLYAKGGKLPSASSVITNDTDKPQRFQTLEEVADELGVDLDEADEPTDVSDLPEADEQHVQEHGENVLVKPTPKPERKRRTKAEIEAAKELVAKGYTEDEVKEHQLRGVPLRELSSDDATEAPVANESADAWEAGTDVANGGPAYPAEPVEPVVAPTPQHGTPPVEEVAPATSTEDAAPATGWAPQW